MSKYTYVMRSSLRFLPLLVTGKWLALARVMYSMKLVRAGLEENWVVLQNARVHYWTGGNPKGETLLLVHGFGVDSVLNWHKQVPPLARRYRLIFPDLVWFGGSTSSKSDYTIDFQARTIEQLIQHLNVRNFNLMGHSYGGVVAAMIATWHPGEVDKFAIIDSPAAPNVMTEEEKTERQQELGIQKAEELLIPDNSKQLKRMLGHVYYKPPAYPSLLLKMILPEFKANEAQRRQMLTYFEENIDNFFQRSGFNITQKTLIVWGDNDALFPVAAAQRIANQIKGECQVKVIKQAGHFPGDEKTEEFNRILLDFLGEH